MLSRRTFVTSICCSCVVAVGLFGSTASAAQEEREYVSFRLQEWRRLHIHDTSEAEKLVELLKGIGCETETHNHGNHLDVQYRCTEWKRIALTNEADAQRWETWLKEKGFEAQYQR